MDRVEGSLGPETYAKQSDYYGPDCTLEVWASGIPVASLRVQQNYAALMVSVPPQPGGRGRGMEGVGRRRGGADEELTKALSVVASSHALHSPPPHTHTHTASPTTHPGGAATHTVLTPLTCCACPLALAALQAGSVTADSISPAGSLQVTTAEGSFADDLPGQVSIKAVTLTEPATCTKSPSYFFFEEFNELGPHRCKTDCGCRFTRTCSSDGHCQELVPEPATCDKSPSYFFPEDIAELGPHRCKTKCGCYGTRICSSDGQCQNGVPEPATCDKSSIYTFSEEDAALGPHRCKTDCGCDGTRFCSSAGQCQDLAPEPATCTKSPDYQFDEEHAALGPHRCKTICGCRGSRTCSGYGYCEDAFGWQPTPAVEGQSPSDSPAKPQQAAAEPSSPAEPQQPAPEPSSPSPSPQPLLLLGRH